METPTPKKQKQRAPQRLWKRFYKLDPGEAFDFKGRLFTASLRKFRLPFDVLIVDMEERAVIWPWTRVRTHTLRHPESPVQQQRWVNPFDQVRDDIDNRIAETERSGTSS